MYYPLPGDDLGGDRDRRRTHGGLALERRGTQIAQRGVPTALVIEHLDVIEQLPLGLAAAVEVLAEFIL